MRLREWFYWILFCILIFTLAIMELLPRQIMRRIFKKSYKRSDIIISNIKKSLKSKE